MASKTYEGRNEVPTDDSKIPIANIALKPSGAKSAGIGDGDGDGKDDDPDGDGAVVDVEGGAVVAGAEKKRKRKKPKKKSGPTVQSSPPRVLLSNLFPSGIYPEGETLKYDNENLSRTTREELRYLNHMDDEFLTDYRQAAEVHRQVRQWAQKTIKPGQSLTDIAVEIEEGVRALLGHQGLEPGDSLKGGMGFPTGLCLNNCAAHWTPNPGRDLILKKEDVMKIDFGVHINGRIVDSAFTMSFDPLYDNLLAAVKDATNTGIRNAGIDARMGEIGAAIQEAMESYEVEIKGKTYPVKAVRNITGHDIKQYQIHGGKSIPFVKSNDQTKMEEGEVFAIETFGTTGRGYLSDDVGIYGYGKSYNAPKKSLNSSSAANLLKTINENFGTIVFCRRYLERLGVKDYLYAMKHLESKGIVESYAPLVDVKGSYVAQFEHTILLRENGKEIISRGEDY